MSARRVVLLNEDSPKGRRFLSARIGDNGDLSIEGQDLGAGVEEFWGEGFREYEWAIGIRALHVPRFFAALGGKEEDDILSLLATRYSEDAQYAERQFLEERAVPFEFWNRVGE